MQLNYVVGIDVGSYSVGLAAVEVDSTGQPVGLLSAVSHIHDSGLDPTEIKSAKTRMETSGVARRTRRLFRRKRRRLVQLDKFILDQGWPVPEFEEFEDPYFPWKARAELARDAIKDPDEMNMKLSVALRHIARHRGWRNPYRGTSSLYSVIEPSEAFNTIRIEMEKTLGLKIPKECTVSQMVSLATFGSDKLRGEGGLLSARLQQSDHSNEIWSIAKKQGLSEELTRRIIDKVFAAESPKGSNASRTGRDPLQPGKTRALKATDAFQRYRIAALIGNLRIRNLDEKRQLTKEEQALVFDHLANAKPTVDPTWVTVSAVLGIDRGQLVGTAVMTDDGERAGSRPPVHDTNRQLLSSKVKPLRDWWKNADEDARAVMVRALSNGEMEDFDSPAGAEVQAFFAELTDEDQEKLDSLSLPFGRAAYSEDTLKRLTKRMRENGLDLYQARLAEFGVLPEWVPPAPRIGEQVGNPAVDRVLKVVARWLEASIKTWGIPQSVNIEHVRAAFISESKTREIERDNKRRHDRNVALFADMQKKLGVEGHIRRADLWRYQSVQRQNGQCAYCGSPITFHNSEMDHIVPRAGEGSTNIRENLVAVCHRCNVSKGNISFATWAMRSDIPGVSLEDAKERTRHWVTDPGMKLNQFRDFTKKVVSRLSRTADDEPLDARSLESVAWMANELRSRIHQRLKNTTDDVRVRVYKGALTSEARKAAGIEKQIPLIGGPGKTRLDRRHHAVDAIVIAFMSPYVAEVLAQRSNHRFDQELREKAPNWKDFTGADAAHRSEFSKWKKKMQHVAAIIVHGLNNDEILVMSNIRLRLGNGAVHEDTMSALASRKLGDALPLSLVDRASSEALWCALTRHPDFDWKQGLPEDSTRRIKVNGREINANDPIDFFPVSAGCLAVRGGYVELGSTFHHVRIFRVPSGKSTAYFMLRVYAVDLARYRNQDLFNVQLLPQTMSMRQAPEKLRTALREDRAEYLGWLVVDDELEVDMTSLNLSKVAVAQQTIGAVNRWRLDGFYSASRLRLRPIQISKEGLQSDAPAELKSIVDSPGWLIAVNQLFGKGDVTVVRRDSLGRPRLASPANLPITWKV